MFQSKHSIPFRRNAVVGYTLVGVLLPFYGVVRNARQISREVSTEIKTIVFAKIRLSRKSTVYRPTVAFLLAKFIDYEKNVAYLGANLAYLSVETQWQDIFL